ncbi:MAG: helix-turn-helix domain-containing protein [Blastocatellia bacterium]
MKTIELQIDRVLKERGKSAYWLSHQTGIDESALVRLRKQRTKGIQWKTLIPLCEALECSPADLIVMVDEKEGSKKKAKE